MTDGTQQQTDEMKYFRNAVQELIKGKCKFEIFINERQEDILIAFMAKYRLPPEEIVFCQQYMEGGEIKYWVEPKTPLLKEKSLKNEYRRLFQKEREKSLCEKIHSFFTKWRK
jgi:hypothetical protein